MRCVRPIDADVRRYFNVSDIAYELLQERVQEKYYDASVTLYFDYMNMTMKAIAYCERDRKSVKPVYVSIEYEKILDGYTYEDLSEDIIKELDKRYGSKKPKKIPAPTTRPRVYYCQSCGAPVKVGATRCDYYLSEFVYEEVYE